MLKKTTELFQPTKGVDHTTGIRSTSGRVHCFELQEFSKVGLFVAPVKTLKLSFVIIERPNRSHNTNRNLLSSSAFCSEEQEDLSVR